MKALFSLFVFLCILKDASAKTYYFSSSGNDSRSATEAQSQSTPWKSISKLNSISRSLQPGDFILFKRGDVFYGTIEIAASGSSGSPITIGAYGSGAKPVITGFVTLSNWVSVGGGKYECYNSALGTSVNIVTVNGVNQEMGRYPNSDAENGGYLNFESHGSNYIKDNQLTSSTNWKGAELVVRAKRYTLDRTKVTSHSGTQLHFSPALSYSPTDGFGYFFQNDIRTLDRPGEWYYNPSTKKLTVYFGSNSPSNYTVKASALTSLVDIYNENDLVFDNLTFTGSAERTIEFYSSHNITLKNSDIAFSGIDGILASNGRNVKIEGNNISNTNNLAVTLSGCMYSFVQNNAITNTGLLPGMGRSGAGKSTAIKEFGEHNLIAYNTIEKTGYIGITFKGNYTVVKNNFINYFNLVKDDGSGIYTQNTSPNDDHYGLKILGNIVMNGIGAAYGTSSSTAASTTGIYMDDHASNVEITGNTVTMCSKTGIYLHNANKITLRDNNVYDNKTQLTIVHDTRPDPDPIRNLVVKNNIFFSKTTSQTVMNIWTVLDDIGSMGIFDSNYYCRPLDDYYVIKATYVSAGKYISQDFDLETWQKAYNKDLASKRTAAQVEPHKLKALVGSNKFSNGDFNSSISGVNAGVSVSSTASYTKSWISSKLDKGTFQGSISSSKTCAYVISVPVGTISANKKYIVSFSMLNSKESRVNVYLRKPSSPYTILSNDGVKSVVKVGTSTKHCEYAFTPTSSESDAVLMFEVMATSQMIWTDKINVYEADVTVTNPDDSIRLVYNDMQSSKTVALNGTYVDARNKSYSNSISLAPYASAILIKKAGGSSSSSSNAAPTVSITSPLINATYNAPASVTIAANASDADGSVAKVQFYEGTTLLHTEYHAPYKWTWNNASAGTHSITAKAIDNEGATKTSTAVSITIKNGNAAPTVSITSPLANATYNAPASVTIAANASDADGSVAKVQFYQGTTLLHTEYHAPYKWIWNNASAGTYSITAKAIDNNGAVKTSTAVSITVRKGATNSIVSSPLQQATEVQVNKTMAAATPFDFRTYPNPASDKLFVECNGSQSNQQANLIIRNLSGSTVRNIPVNLSGKGISVDVSSLSAGMYVLSITNANVTVSKKFLKAD